MSESEWDDIMEINLKSCFNTVKAALDLYETKKWLNYQYVLCRRHQRKFGSGKLCGFKGRYHRVLKSVALELGSRGIRCTLLLRIY